MMKLITFILFGLVLISLQTRADLNDDAETILNWAESVYPDLLSPQTTTMILDEWRYRYYSDTDIYAGINDSGEVAVLGGIFGGLQVVGAVDAFLALATPKDKTNGTRRLKTWTTVSSDGVVNMTVTYAYDTHGNLISVTIESGGYTSVKTYTYRNGELTESENVTSFLPKIQTYSYQNGRINLVHYPTNLDDELNSKTLSIAYNENGDFKNTTSTTDHKVDGIVKSIREFTYDTDNTLAQLRLTLTDNSSPYYGEHWIFTTNDQGKPTTIFQKFSLDGTEIDMGTYNIYYSEENLPTSSESIPSETYQQTGVVSDKSNFTWETAACNKTINDLMYNELGFPLAITPCE